jgi:hypothetical protein
MFGKSEQPGTKFRAIHTFGSRSRFIVNSIGRLQMAPAFDLCLISILWVILLMVLCCDPAAIALTIAVADARR